MSMPNHVALKKKKSCTFCVLIRSDYEQGLLGSVFISCWDEDESDSVETKPDRFVHVYWFYELE